MATKNKKTFSSVVSIIEKEKRRRKSKNDGVFVMAVYKKKRKTEIKALVNGITPDELDIILREIYGKVYSIRKKNDKELIKKFKKKNNV